MNDLPSDLALALACKLNPAQIAAASREAGGWIVTLHNNITYHVSNDGRLDRAMPGIYAGAYGQNVVFIAENI
jgi:hypothetical protein